MKRQKWKERSAKAEYEKITKNIEIKIACKILNLSQHQILLDHGYCFLSGALVL